MNSTTSKNNYPHGRLQLICTLILPVVAAACLWMARPQDDSTSAVRTTTTITSPLGSEEQNSTSVKSAGEPILTSVPVSSPKLVTRPIEDIRPGMRVLACNPELTETLPDSNVTPEDWRLVSLTMTKENGGKLQVQLLRPLEWFLTEVVVLLGTCEDPESLYNPPVLVTAVTDTTDYKLQQLLLGQAIHLDLPELGAQGLATVTSIDPCPPLDTPQSGRRLVTGTFRHAAANVIDLQVGGESEPFGCTNNHPFWSEDRHQFVEAGELLIGERLQSADGTITQVTKITPRRGPPVDVFNFEVDVDHVYHVGASGVLVHNSCDVRGQIHHIATHYGVIGQRFKSLFSRAGVDIQSAYNKVRIPQHVGPHGWYNDYIFDRLSNAVGNATGDEARRRLIDELMELRWQLRNTDLGDLLRASG